MKRIGIRNLTEGRIALNKLGHILLPRKENRYLFLEVGDQGLIDSELIALHQNGMIEVVDADQLPKAAAIQPTAPIIDPPEPSPETVPVPEEMQGNPTYLLEWAWAVIANVAGGDWDKETPQWKAAATKWRDTYHKHIEEITLLNPPPIVFAKEKSEVTVMTPEGAKRGTMKYSISGEAPQAMALPTSPEPKMLDLNKY